MLKPLLYTLIAAAGLARAQAPATPIAAFPSDKATAISIYTSIKWKTVAGATAYHLQVAADSAFGSPFFEDSTLTDTLAAMKRLADSTTYYWHVRARNASGFGAFSKVRSFLTQPPLDAGPVVVSPPDFANDIPTSTVLTWEKFPEAKTYWVQVSLESNFANILLSDSAVSDTQKAIDQLTPGTYYYWHVRAVNGTTKSGWTKARFVTVDLAGVGNQGMAERERHDFRILPGISGGHAAVEFRLESPARLALRAYGIRGEEAGVMAAGNYPAGVHRAELTGLRTGIYFLRLRVEGNDANPAGRMGQGDRVRPIEKAERVFVP